jgi:hypothetical protein
VSLEKRSSNGAQKKGRTIAPFGHVKTRERQISPEGHKIDRSRHRSVKVTGEEDSYNSGLTKMTQERLKPKKRKNNIWSKGFQRVVPSDRTISTKKSSPDKDVTPNTFGPRLRAIIPMSRFSITPDPCPMDTIRKIIRTNTVVPETSQRVVQIMTSMYTKIMTAHNTMGEHALA